MLFQHPAGVCLLLLCLLYTMLGGVDSATTTIDGAIANHINASFQQVSSEFMRKYPSYMVTSHATVSSIALKEMDDHKIDFAITQNTPPDVTACDGNGHVTFPIFAGVGGMYHNVPSSQQVQLDPCALADIFIGNIKTWNHPNITKLNPGLWAVSQPIRVIVREDPASVIPLSIQFHRYVIRGCPYAANYYSETNITWPSSPIYLKVVKIKDVVAFLQNTTYSIGFVQSSEATNSMPEVAIRNKDGAFVTAKEAQLPSSAELPLLRQQEDPSCWGQVDTTYASGQDTHPFTYLVYFIAHRTAHSRAPAATVSFANYWLSDDVQRQLVGYKFLNLTPAMKGLSTKAAALLGPKLGKKDDSKDVGAIAGGIIGGVAGVAILSAIAFFLVRRSKDRKQHNVLLV